MEEINIYNVYEHVTYEFNENVIKIIWDHTNTQVNELMVLEAKLFLIKHIQIQKASCCWVDILKKYTEWENGEKIYFKGVSSRKGLIEIIIYMIKVEVFGAEIIDENGYLLLRDYETSNNEYTSIRKKCDCIYNDLLDQGNDPYILK